MLKNILPRLNFPSILNSVRSNPKVFAIPTLMMTSYMAFGYSNQSKHFSSKTAMMREENKLRKFLLEGCENIREGEMKPFKYGEKDDEAVLVIRYNGSLHALSNSCPHFGAPMNTGILIDNVLKCPWHGASFDIRTGKTDISPAINDMIKYTIHYDKDSSIPYVLLPETIQKTTTPLMTKRDPSDKRKFVIIGGGPAGLSAAEALRQTGYTGEIIVLSSDKYLPYDRTMLSKFIPPNVNRISYRGPEFLKEYDIDIKTDTKVVDVNNKRKIIKLQDGTEVSYEKLLIASGASALIPNIPGHDKSHVFTLRSFGDLEKLAAACKNAKNIVIVGGNFIGMESASMLKNTFKNSSVTIIDKNPTPFYQSLGKEIGSALQRLHEKNGVKFMLKNRVASIQDSTVRLEDGTQIDADVVLFGVGILPNTDIVKDVAKSNYSIKTDKYLNTSDENIFAAGDVTSVPYFHTGEYLSFAHYVNAQQQGAIAAMNMLGQRVPYEYVPYYWSRQWDKSIQYTGCSETYDEVFIDGDLSELKFVAYYLKKNNIVGFASMNVPNASNIMYEAFRNNKLPRGSLIKDGTANLNTIKESLKGVKPKCLRADCVCIDKNKI